VDAEHSLTTHEKQGSANSVEGAHRPWVETQSGGKRTKLGAGDFPTAKVAHIEFPDGSAAQFRYAIVIGAPEISEVGVFTEHCGDHIFPLVDTKVRMQQTP
jgi:hypothetical protein